MKCDAEVARVAEGSRARVSQVMDLLALAPATQVSLVSGELAFGEHRLRAASRTAAFATPGALLGLDHSCGE